MTKHILSQYCDLQEEVKDLRRRIRKLETQIQKIEDGGNVIDSVTGGYGGIQHFKVEGFPYPEYSRKKTFLYLRKANLEALELDLMELTTNVEEYINNLGSSRIRRILRYRFIDGLSQNAIAYKLHIDQSVVSREIAKHLNES